MEKDFERTKELQEEIKSLADELEMVRERERDLEDTRRAMLYLLEDINESAAQVLRAKRDWEATFDSISDPVFIHDIEMNILRCNDAYRRASGLDYKDIIGRKYHSAFPRTSVPRDSCANVPGAVRPGEEVETIRHGVKIFKVRAFPVMGDGEI